MPKQKNKIPIKKLLMWAVLAGILVATPRISTTLNAQPSLRTIEDVEPHKYAIVLAAEVKEDGSPSLVLRHRVERGVDLYMAEKAKKLIMSGKERETTVMRAYAISLGMPEEDILLDSGGIRTYATCYNAVNYFKLEKAIVVTQPYHTPRTLFLCDMLGLEAVAVPAHHGTYWRGSWVVWQLRETLATVLAFKDIFISAPDTSEYITLAQEGASNDQ